MDKKDKDIIINSLVICVILGGIIGVALGGGSSSSVNEKSTAIIFSVLIFITIFIAYSLINEKKVEKIDPKVSAEELENYYQHIKETYKDQNIEDYFPLGWANGLYVGTPKDGLEYTKEHKVIKECDFFTGEGHMLTVAGSRAGKGASLILPNLLIDSNNSFVVLDIKGENTAVTLNYQKSIGRNVIVLDPFNHLADMGINCEVSNFNPLSAIDINSPFADDDVTSCILSFTPIHEKSEPFWVQRARVLMRGLILYHLAKADKSEWTLLNLYDILRKPIDELKAHIDVGCGYQLSEKDLNQFIEFTKKDSDEKLFISIVQVARDYTEFLKVFSNKENIIDIDKIRSEKTTLYLVIDKEKLGSYGSWVKLVTTAIIKRMCKKVGKRRVVFMLDEYPQLGKMDSLTEDLQLTAGYNITFWVFVQNIVQLKHVYGDSWEIYFDVAFSSFRNITEQTTLEYLSKTLGHHEIIKDTFSETRSSGNNSSTQSYTVSKEIKYQPSEVKSILRSKTLNITRGVETFVDWPRYYETYCLKDRAGENPLI